MPKILAFAGSARRGSYNRKLVAHAAQAAREAGADVTLVELFDYPMPMYDGDTEEADGIPEPAQRLYGLALDCDGLLIACPEYNSSITPLLKNTIDWLSRPRDGDPPLAAFRGKTAALLAASPGALGGLRGLVHVRAILGNIGVVILPDQVAVPSAHQAFDGDGRLTDETATQRVHGAVAELVRVTGALTRT